MRGLLDGTVEPDLYRQDTLDLAALQLASSLGRPVCTGLTFETTKGLAPLGFSSAHWSVAIGRQVSTCVEVTPICWQRNLTLCSSP
jgi:hypothetical protein